MPAVLEILQKTTGFLESKGVESPRLNAEILVGHALGLGRMQLYLQFERGLTDAELEKLRPLVRRRGLREPLGYVLGQGEFFGLRLKLDRRALIPRPETERLVEILIALWPEAPRRALDLGTGSGALALALARAWPASEVTAVDRSADALALARENAAANGLESKVVFFESDWFAGLPGEPRFALAVANPPYLDAREAAEAAPEVREHEPSEALIAPAGGLADLRSILETAPRYLEPGGMLALETGPGHHAELLRLAGGCGFVRIESRQDLAGRDRYVLAWVA